MSIRSFFGLCDHRWRDTGGIIEKKVSSVVTPSAPARVIGYKAVRECERCGIVRSFPL